MPGEDGPGTPAAEEDTQRWTFLTNHARVLVCLHDDPTMRIRDVAARTNLTDRTVKTIIEDLASTGYLSRTRVGRRNTYAVHPDSPLVPGGADQRPVQGLLDAVGDLAHLDFQDVLDTIARNIVEFMGDASLISLAARDQDRLVPVAAQHRDPETGERMLELLAAGHVPLGRNLAGLVIDDQKAVSIEDIAADSPYDMAEVSKALVDRYGLRAIVLVPLVADDEAIGLIGAARTNPKDPFTDEDIALLKTFAGRAATTIADARRTRANLAAEAYGTLFAVSGDGAMVSTPDGRLLASNPAACAMLRGTETEVTRLHRGDLIDDTDPALQAAREERRRTGITEYTTEVKRLDGTTFTAFVRNAEFTTTAGEPRVALVFREVDPG